MKYFSAILLCTCIYMNVSFGAEDNSLSDAQRVMIKKYLEEDKGKEALVILRPFINETSAYDILILTARSNAANDNPNAALDFYNRALKKANTAEEKRVALFGIAKMQFWLDQYVRAEQTYRKILNQPDLNAEDKELALAGVVKSLAYYDRPRKAYHLVPPDLHFKTAQMTVAAAQASLWSDWPDITNTIINNNAALLKDIPPKSALGKDMRDVQWQTDLATSKNVISPGYFYSGDSDSFFVRKPSLAYTRYWNQMFQTNLRVDQINYTQAPLNLSARDLSLTQTIRPTRALIFRGNIKPSEYSHWHPFLWFAEGAYYPNDYLNFKLLALKEVVETFPSFENEITTNNYTASMNINPFPYVYLNGSTYQLNFSDTNQRKGYFLLGRVNIWTQIGLSALFRFRSYTDDFQSPNYFSPEVYKERMYILRLGRKYDTVWHYYLDGGMGRQWFTSAPGEPSVSSLTHQWGVGLQGPIGKHLTIDIFYADLFQASAFINSTGYHYQYGAVTLNILC